MEEELKKIVEEELESTKRRLLEVEKELDSIKGRLLNVVEELDSIKGRLLNVVEEFDSSKTRLLARINRIIKDRNQKSSPQRIMKLVFRNWISRTIFTGEEIKGEDDAPIEVALVDDSTGNIVKVERESSSNVEIVLVKGEFDASEGDDWTFEEFQANTVPEMKGEGPIFTGDVLLKLHRGIGSLDNIKLRHHTSKIKPRRFRLGARVVDTSDRRARVKEAMTERFIVKNYRDKYKKKHTNPSLSDEVWRLIYIGKDGPIHERLKSEKICTVQDFLIRLLIDPEGLKTKVKLGEKKWKATVNNAEACPNFGQILGLYSKNQYFTDTMLSENHKVNAQKLLESAYEHQKDTVYFNDEDSLQQHFTSFSTFVNSQGALEPYCPLVGDDICYGESSNGHSNSSFQSINSTGDDDFLDLLNTDEMEILCDGRSQLTPPPSDQQNFLSYVEYVLLHQSDNMDMSNANEPPIDLQTWISRFGDCLHQNDNSDRSNADEPMTASSVVFVESVADNIKPSKRWKTYFNASIWIFFVKKLACFGSSHKQKKQKVC